MISHANLRVSRLAIGLACVASMSASIGAEHRIECPPSLPQESVQIVQPPAGWTSFVRTSVRLNSAGLMFGPPSEMAISKPDRVESLPGKGIERWTGLDGAVPGGKWMACNYGRYNELIMSKRIDDNTSECSVTYTKAKHGDDHVDIVCKW